MADPMDPTPEDHPAKDAVEDVAEDFSEVWQEAERLRRLVEEKLSRWTTRPDERVKDWASKLTSLKDKLERALADVDARTDELAGRFPRRPPQGPRHL